MNRESAGPGPGPLDPSRRVFTRGLVECAVTYALLQSLFRRDLFARPVSAVTREWLVEVETLGRDLHGGRLTPLQWQDRAENLFARLDLKELLRLIDFDRLEKTIDLPEDHAAVQAVRFPGIEALPDGVSFGSKVFALKQGRAIVPHGHRNMVSGHVILKGLLHVRHYDRLEDQPKHLLLRPTLDRLSGPGTMTTTSSERDNVHWFVAATGPAFTFDVIVDNLDPALGFPWRMDFLDPLGGETAGDGRIRARRIGYEEAIGLYGRS